MSAKLVFPTFIYTGNLGKSLNKDLAKEIETLSEIDEHGQKWSAKNYTGGYSSYSSMTKLHHTSPNFADLEKKLKPHIKNFSAKLNWDLMGRKLAMTTCWANSMGYAANHTLHSHPLSVLSGVYYVTVPKN